MMPTKPPGVPLRSDYTIIHMKVVDSERGTIRTGDSQMPPAVPTDGKGGPIVHGQTAGATYRVVCGEPMTWVQKWAGAVLHVCTMDPRAVNCSSCQKTKEYREHECSPLRAGQPEAAPPNAQPVKPG